MVPVAIDLGLLTIDGAVFHQVPTRPKPGDDGEHVEPVLSTVESSLDGRLEFFLRDRLIRTLDEAAQPVCVDEDIASPTPGLVQSALGDGAAADIVGPFHILPALLLEVQAHNSPRGLLAVLRGACGGDRVLVLVKVEQERGLSFETFEEDGQIRVEVVIEDGLVFTDKTEVFKAAMFWLEDGELLGYVTDDQTGSIYRGPSSKYWLNDFLGCRYSVEEDVLTRAWIKGTERLIKSDLRDPVERSNVIAAMAAELASNRRSIDPRRFIREQVPTHAQDAARQRLLNEGAPVRQFVKSREVSRGAPRRKRFVLDTGVEVTMPVDASPELSTEDANGDALDVLTVRGRIRRVDS